MKEAMLMQYLRDKKNNKVGVMVGVLDNGVPKLGLSRCSKWDTFDKELGIEIAVNRAYSAKQYRYVFYDDKLSQQVVTFLDRCSRYFKQSKFTKLEEMESKNV